MCAKEHLNTPGSQWHRWEPHIHAPGTILNDGFTGDDCWERYLTALEQAAPTIKAIGLTDYYSLDCYERFVKEAVNRLPNAKLIFPNVEMRLAVGTIKSKWVNLHLLFSPEDPDHVLQARRFLARFHFDAHDDRFTCSRDDLIKLGYKCDPKIRHDGPALRKGTEQFKIDFKQLKEVYSGSKWAQENILVGVAASESDGTSGVRDNADQTLRQEIEKFAHLIFASSHAQREFWLGQGVLPKDDMDCPTDDGRGEGSNSNSPRTLRG